jgi:AraC-like DNA-binding protein
MELLETIRLVAVTATFALILFAVALLVVQRTTRRDQALLLAAFLGLYGLVKVHEILLVTDAYPSIPHLAGTHYPVIMLLGPVIYFYTRAMTSPEPVPFGRRDLWAPLGFVVVLIINLPGYLVDGQTKAALMRHAASQAEIATSHLRCNLVYSLFLIYSVGCLVAAFRLFVQHTKRIRSVFSNLEDRSLAWLRAVLFILALGWSWDTAGQLTLLTGGNPAWFAAATSVFELGWIAVIAFFGVQQPPIFTAQEVPVEAPKYSRSALTEERMIRIAAKLEMAMTRDRLFENPDLSLRTLSDHVGVSENHISQTLNDHLHVNFFDFVNSHRIAAARDLLVHSTDSVVAVAYTVGFNSRSTFNAAFKKHSGATPTEYRDSAKLDIGPDLAFARMS